ncbi:MAG: ABC-F family ATP-binding cassette domain-containing protein [Planctomycetes bacterium]|nr:ABC-F family ATP-binding cassette domain-containing protein [Planctomycetota bacterium]
MALLTLKDIHVTLGDRHLLQGVSLVVGDGDRIGLLGANGCGKSTLLRILAGDLVADAGERAVRRDLRLGWLPQEPRLPTDQAVATAVVQGIAGRAEVLAALARVHDALARDPEPGRLERLLREQQQLDERLEHLGGHDVDHRAASLLSALGMDRAEARCGDLSGGEKRRVALARLLLAEPDLLLLDEPTNHLDAQVTDWLETFLLDRGTPLVMVTHDRYFLDRLCTRIVEFDQGRLFDYEGGYRSYLVERAARLEQEARAESARLNTLRRETEWVKRGPPARTTKAKARIDRHAALLAAAPPPSAAELEFAIPDGPRLGDFVLRLRGVGKAFAGRTILRPFDLELGPGQRLGIVGRNGAGKTTLLKLCLGELAPDQGSVAVAPTVRFATIDQARSTLSPDKTVLEEVANGNDYVVVAGRGVRVETFLEQFLFPGAMKHARVGALSGGERNRVLLAKLLCAGGNVLVLDEPTNDLDLASLRALEDALLAFAGAVIVVSHDRWFLDRVATRVVHLDGSGAVRVHEGDLSLLLERLAAEQAARAKAVAAAEAAARERTRATAARAAPAKARRLSSREQQELAGLPAAIEAAEHELAEVDLGLQDPTTYAAGARERFDDLTARRRTLPDRIAALYARWEELEAIAEQARGA